MKYQWAEGAPFSGPVEPVAEALKKLGQCTAADVVRAAKPASSPLHKYIFHLNNKQAAAEYYLSRARLLTRSVVYVEVERDNIVRRAFQFVEVPRNANEVAQSRVIITDQEMRLRPEWRDQVLARLTREVERAVAELRDIEGTDTVTDLLGRLLELLKPVEQVV